MAAAARSYLGRAQQRGSYGPSEISRSMSDARTEREEAPRALCYRDEPADLTGPDGQEAQHSRDGPCPARRMASLSFLV